MKTKRWGALALAGALVGLAMTAGVAQADTLDKIISEKKMRCGVQLDFPPLGFRDMNNQPEGYDVAYCKDIAKALGAELEIVETPSPERIPALVSGRIDVLVAGTTITPQRALSVAFTQPYIVHTVMVLTREDAGISNFNDLKGRTVGGVTGTTPALALEKFVKDWNDPKAKFLTYGNEAESFMALNQGKIDALLLASGTAGALIKSGQFPSFTMAGEAPVELDLGGIAVRKSDTEFLRWLKVFVWNQGITGRYKELYNTYFAPGDAPALGVPGIY
ncbi:ABC transporter substrate-binding protein [Castellaniella sp. S9]|uniref:ABC transporter substrate-binding protein n=1 Tax=Castellaniella sp. S9 TaxID=2993652 RepID=UPI0022B3E0E2|nr:transporter substrate-binding domain-containing protein [Castellaniella sp. S9]